MDSSPVPPQKKGLGTLGWLGIGCGALIVLGIVVVAAIGLFYGPQFRKIGEDFQKDPTRAMANTTMNVSMGTLEMVAQDEVNKRYTLRAKSSGKLITIYWDAKQGKPVTVEGDFSAIPPDANSPVTPTPN